MLAIYPTIDFSNFHLIIRFTHDFYYFEAEVMSLTPTSKPLATFLKNVNVIARERESVHIVIYLICLYNGKYINLIF